MLLTLGAGAVPTGMSDARVPSTVLALREAVAVSAAWALWDGADALPVGGGECGRALKILWSEGGEEITQGRPGKSPCMRVWRRA